jgi:hypothetical protein
MVLNANKPPIVSFKKIECHGACLSTHRNYQNKVMREDTHHGVSVFLP